MSQNGRNGSGNSQSTVNRGRSVSPQRNLTRAQIIAQQKVARAKEYAAQRSVKSDKATTVGINPNLGNVPEGFSVVKDSRKNGSGNARSQTQIRTNTQSDTEKGAFESMGIADYLINGEYQQTLAEYQRSLANSSSQSEIEQQKQLDIKSKGALFSQKLDEHQETIIEREITQQRVASSYSQRGGSEGINLQQDASLGVYSDLFSDDKEEQLNTDLHEFLDSNLDNSSMQILKNGRDISHLRQSYSEPMLQQSRSSLLTDVEDQSDNIQSIPPDNIRYVSSQQQTEEKQVGFQTQTLNLNPQYSTDGNGDIAVENYDEIEDYYRAITAPATERLKSVLDMQNQQMQDAKPPQTQIQQSRDMTFAMSEVDYQSQSQQQNLILQDSMNEGYDRDSDLEQLLVELQDRESLKKSQSVVDVMNGEKSRNGVLPPLYVQTDALNRQSSQQVNASQLTDKDFSELEDEIVQQHGVQQQSPQGGANDGKSEIDINASSLFTGEEEYMVAQIPSDQNQAPIQYEDLGLNAFLDGLGEDQLQQQSQSNLINDTNMQDISTTTPNGTPPQVVGQQDAELREQVGLDISLKDAKDTLIRHAEQTFDKGSTELELAKTYIDNITDEDFQVFVQDAKTQSMDNANLINGIFKIVQSGVDEEVARTLNLQDSRNVTKQDAQLAQQLQAQQTQVVPPQQTTSQLSSQQPQSQPRVNQGQQQAKPGFFQRMANTVQGAVNDVEQGMNQVVDQMQEFAEETYDNVSQVLGDFVYGDDQQQIAYQQQQALYQQQVAQQQYAQQQPQQYQYQGQQQYGQAAQQPQYAPQPANSYETYQTDLAIAQQNANDNNVSRLMYEHYDIDNRMYNAAQQMNNAQFLLGEQSVATIGYLNQVLDTLPPQERVDMFKATMDAAKGFGEGIDFKSGMKWGAGVAALGLGGTLAGCLVQAANMPGGLGENLKDVFSEVFPEALIAILAAAILVAIAKILVSAVAKSAESVNDNVKREEASRAIDKLNKARQALQADPTNPKLQAQLENRLKNVIALGGEKVTVPKMDQNGKPMKDEKGKPVTEEKDLISKEDMQKYNAALTNISTLRQQQVNVAKVLPQQYNALNNRRNVVQQQINQYAGVQRNSSLDGTITPMQKKFQQQNQMMQQADQQGVVPLQSRPQQQRQNAQQHGRPGRPIQQLQVKNPLGQVRVSNQGAFQAPVVYSAAGVQNNTRHHE